MTDFDKYMIINKKHWTVIIFSKHKIDYWYISLYVYIYNLLEK